MNERTAKRAEINTLDEKSAILFSLALDKIKSTVVKQNRKGTKTNQLGHFNKGLKNSGQEK